MSSSTSTLRVRTTAGRRSLAGVAKPEILRTQEVNGFDWLVHGFSTRPHGHSTAYSGDSGRKELNLGFTSSDRKTNVQKNRAAFLHALLASKAPAELVTLSQIHSDVIHVVTGSPKAPLAGDGMITRIPGLLLGIQTADCVPVLVAAPAGERPVVAAFHAGWRGTVMRIVEKGVGTMRMAFDCDPQTMQALIGPCIHQCCYAVGAEVEEEFRSQFRYADALLREVYDKNPIKDRYPLLFMTARAPGHFNINCSTHLDLVEANRRQLLDSGIPAGNIHTVGNCTCCNRDYLWSHRGESGFAGRMMAVIGIR